MCEDSAPVVVWRMWLFMGNYMPVMFTLINPDDFVDDKKATSERSSESKLSHDEDLHTVSTFGDFSGQFDTFTPLSHFICEQIRCFGSTHCPACSVTMRGRGWSARLSEQMDTDARIHGFPSRARACSELINIINFH